LIGRNHHPEPGVIEPGNRFQAAGDRAPFGGRLDELVAVVIDHAIAVENDELDLAGVRNGVGELDHVGALSLP